MIFFNCQYFLYYRSKRTIGLRILQVNLFQEDFSRNSVEIYDGENATAPQIGHIVANSSTVDVQQLYQTTGNVMAVHIHASVSFGSYGFIAEVVKLPLAGLTYPSMSWMQSCFSTPVCFYSCIFLFMNYKVKVIMLWIHSPGFKFGLVCKASLLLHTYVSTSTPVSSYRSHEENLSTVHVALVRIKMCAISDLQIL